jgi:hypothetical protein
MGRSWMVTLGPAVTMASFILGGGVLVLHGSVKGREGLIKLIDDVQTGLLAGYMAYLYLTLLTQCFVWVSSLKAHFHWDL